MFSFVCCVRCNCIACILTHVRKHLVVLFLRILMQRCIISMMITTANWNGKTPPIITVMIGAFENSLVARKARPADATYSAISRIASCISRSVHAWSLWVFLCRVNNSIIIMFYSCLTTKIVILTATSTFPCQKLQIAFNGDRVASSFIGYCVR